MQQKIITVDFVGTADNEADIYTKNTSGDLFEKHTGGYMDNIPYEYSEWMSCATGRVLKCGVSLRQYTAYIVYEKVHKGELLNWQE